MKNKEYFSHSKKGINTTRITETIANVTFSCEMENSKIFVAECETKLEL